MPLEVQAWGGRSSPTAAAARSRPVVDLAQAAPQAGATGILFREPTAAALIEAVRRFEAVRGGLPRRNAARKRAAFQPRTVQGRAPRESLSRRGKGNKQCRTRSPAFEAVVLFLTPLGDSSTRMHTEETGPVATPRGTLIGLFVALALTAGVEIALAARSPVIAKDGVTFIEIAQQLGGSPIEAIRKWSSIPATRR